MSSDRTTPWHTTPAATLAASRPVLAAEATWPVTAAEAGRPPTVSASARPATACGEPAMHRPVRPRQMTCRGTQRQMGGVWVTNRFFVRRQFS